MALISVTLYSDRREGACALYVTCHGVSHGEYGDLWTITRRYPAAPATTVEALRLIAEALLAASGASIPRESA